MLNTTQHRQRNELAVGWRRLCQLGMRIWNASRLFDIVVEFPVSLRLIPALLSVPPTPLHDALFELSYAGYVVRIEGLTVLDLLRTGCSSHDRFVNRNRGN